MYACWSVKGGSGTTVVVAAAGVTCAAERAEGVLLVDLAGDLPAALGLDRSSSRGVRDWLTQSAAGSGPAAAEVDELARLEVVVDERLSVLPRGTASVAGDAHRVPELLARLRGDGRTVICDCGNLAPPDAAAGAIAAGCDVSLLVTRCCYLALRRVPEAPVRPTGVVVVAERGRSLRPDDVAEVVGAPVVAEVVHDPQLARVVDAGLLVARLDRATRRALASVLDR